MDEQAWLFEQFERNRPRLRAMAYRMLGSASDADDAMQDAWLRLSGADAGRIESMDGWLTTVVGRVCIDLLRSRSSRREQSLGALVPDTITTYVPGADPEDELLRADSIGLAVLTVLDALSPSERLAFVLHDMFGVPFDEIAPIVGRSPTAARQLASRARRRVRGARVSRPVLARQQRVIEAFLSAARRGDFDMLIALLDPEVALRADVTAAAASGAARHVRGAQGVAEIISRGARDPRGGQLDHAVVDGAAALVSAPGGNLRLVIAFTIVGEAITGIELIGDRERLSRLAVAIASASGLRP